MMIFKKIALKRAFSILFSFGILTVFGQSKAELIDQLISKYTAYGMFNGSVLVSEKGNVIHKSGYGLANVEWDIKNTSNTKFRIGSITKQFTSMLVMQLVEDGRLDLHAPISTYLSDYPKSKGDKITIEHLLTHTSGIPNFTSFPQYRSEFMRKPFTPEMLVQTFADSTLNFAPGTQYDYSNSGYVLLGYILESVTNQSYEQLLNERIFNPLKMEHSGYDHSEPILPNRAAGYFNSIATYRNAAFIDMSVPYAAGAIYSTVEDLYLWDRALQGNTLVSKKFKDDIFVPRVPAGRFNYGYGWAIGKAPVGLSGDSTNIVFHSGAINGFSALITRFPDEQHCIILTANIASSPLEEITQAITNILFGEAYSLPNKPFVLALAQRIQKHGPRKAAKAFQSMSYDSDYVPINEFEMNQLGYEYLWSGQLEEALTVFKLNIEAFPYSSNVYDSYAEALRAKGDIQGSIRNYQKSIELDPANQNGRNMLAEMGIEIENKPPSDGLHASIIGTYQFMPTFKIKITREGNHVFGQATGQSKLELFQKEGYTYHVPAVDAEIMFIKESDGSIRSLKLIMSGNEQIATRIE